MQPADSSFQSKERISFTRMPKLKLVVENAFIDSAHSSSGLGLTVYNRVFNKLMSGGGPLGKVLPLYLEINGNYKIFGILTLNKSGSYSFFPELADGLPFDHITFVKDLSKNNHHYTQVTPSGREKVLPILAEHLSNDMYHGISFACDPLMLKEGPEGNSLPRSRHRTLRGNSCCILNVWSSRRVNNNEAG